MPDDCDWLLIGDFNLIRNPSDRNMPGGNISEMLWFNEALNSLGVIEIPLHGRKFTWINKQMPLLLDRLDWFFTSNSWTAKFLNTVVRTLVMETSDHWPCVVEINTSIPQPKLFRFENHWLSHEEFISVVVNEWQASGHLLDPARS